MLQAAEVLPGGTTQTVENITTPWKAENKNSTDTKNSLSARNDKDEEQETLVGAEITPRSGKL